MPRVGAQNDELTTRLRCADPRAAITVHAAVNDFGVRGQPWRAAACDHGRKVLPESKALRADPNGAACGETAVDHRQILEERTVIARWLEPHPLGLRGDVRRGFEMILRACRAAAHRIVGEAVEARHQVGRSDGRRGGTRGELVRQGALLRGGNRWRGEGGHEGSHEGSHEGNLARKAYSGHRHSPNSGGRDPAGPRSDSSY